MYLVVGIWSFLFSDDLLSRSHQSGAGATALSGAPTRRSVTATKGGVGMVMSVTVVDTALWGKSDVVYEHPCIDRAKSAILFFFLGDRRILHGGIVPPDSFLGDRRGHRGTAALERAPQPAPIFESKESIFCNPRFVQFYTFSLPKQDPNASSDATSQDCRPKNAIVPKATPAWVDGICRLE